VLSFEVPDKIFLNAVVSCYGDLIAAVLRPTVNLEDQGDASMASYVAIAEREEGNCSSCSAHDRRRNDRRNPPPDREGIIARLKQALTPWAPPPTDEEIDFLTQQCDNLEPGAALSSDPSLLGHEGFDPPFHSNVERRLEPDTAHANEQNRCGDPAFQRPPAQSADDQCNHGPQNGGEETRSLLREQPLDLHQQQGTLQSLTDISSATPPKQSIASKSSVPTSMITTGGNVNGTKYDVDSIKEALRKVKFHVKAVDSLRSFIQYESDVSVLNLDGCDDPVQRQEHLSPVFK
jgi:hypothetical protein